MDTRLLLDAPGQPASKIQIAQLGEFTHGKYGDFTITADDIDSWKRNLANLPGKRALIDLDHRADRSPRNTEAAGWITDIALEDGVPTAAVKWTSIGKRAIEDGRYLFFSPTYGTFTNEKGERFENTLLGGALTNKPHLTAMRTVSLAAPARVVEAYERETDDGWVYTLDVSQAERDLAVKEGNALSDGSYPIRNTGQLHAAAHLAATGHGNVQGARKLIKRRAKEMGVDLKSLPGFEDGDGDTDSRSAMALTETTLKLLDLDDSADEAAVELAITALAAKASEQTKTLESAVADRDKRITLLESAVAGLTKDRADQAFDTIFAKAVREGRTVEAQRETMRKFYELDAEGTEKLLADQPPIVRMSLSGWDNSRENPDLTQPPANTVNADPYVAIKKFMAEKGMKPSEFPRVLEQYLNGEVTL